MHPPGPCSGIPPSIRLRTLRHDAWPPEAKWSKRSATMLLKRCGMERQ